MSGTRPQNQYEDPYNGQQSGYTPQYSEHDTPNPYDDPYGSPPRDNGQRSDAGGYRPHKEEMLRDQYPQDRDIGQHQDRVHPDHSYEYDNPYTQRSEGHGTGGGSTIGPWDSASQRSIAATTVNGQHPHPHIRNKPSSAGLSYIDEEGAYYRSNSQRPASEFMPVAEIEMRGLVNDPSPMAGRHGDRDVEFSGIKGNDYDTSPLSYSTNQMPKYQKPSGVYSWLLFPTGLDRVLAIFGVNMGRLPLEQEIERKKRGIPGQRFPVAAWGLTLGE